MAGWVNSTPGEHSAIYNERVHYSLVGINWHWRTLIAILVFWFIWGMVYAVNLSIVKHNTSLNETWWLAFPDAIVWALLTPPVLWIGRKLPIRAPYLILRILLHIPIGIAVVTLHDLIDAWLNYLLMVVWSEEKSGLTVVEYFQYVVPYKWYSHLFLYAAIIGLAQLLEHRRQLSKTQAQMAMLRANLAESRLEALRFQLQPHFLFNCLNTISGLVNQRPAEARRMIGNLAELLRLALDTEESEIPLERELHFVRTYLQIEQIRFGDRLQIHESIPDTCLSEQVPSFILQPLVENAVRHGLSSSGGGRIEIKAELDEQLISIEIRDDGPGIDKESSRTGIGLSSVRSRLQQLYHNDHELRVDSSPQDGTRVLIKFPRRKNKQGAIR